MDCIKTYMLEGALFFNVHYPNTLFIGHKVVMQKAKTYRYNRTEMCALGKSNVKSKPGLTRDMAYMCRLAFPHSIY